jgi:hypothetical protein
MRALVLCSLATLALACTSSSSDDGPSQGGGGSAELAPPPEGPGLQLAFDATVPAGSEVHVCKEFVVPGDGELAIDRFETQAPEGMHHILAYRTPKTAADVTGETFDCGDVPGAIWYEQSADGAAAKLPAGVGIKLQPGEVVRVELHDLNVGSTDETRTVRLNAWRAKAPLTAEAGSLFMYDRDIAVPAHGSFTARMHCEIPTDITIADILPHEHVHGTGERIYLSGGDLAEPKLIVSTSGYGDQELRKFDAEPLVVKAGQSLDFECDYDNTTDEDVVEGPSKEHNEMCMILGDYYPKMDRAGEWCTSEGSGPAHDGANTCGAAYEALQSGNNVDYASEQTIVGVCAAASDAWNALGNCGFNACSDVCPGPDCSACAAKSCVNQYVACMNAACE